MSLQGRELCPELPCASDRPCKDWAQEECEIIVGPVLKEFIRGSVGAACRRIPGANVMRTEGIIRCSPCYSDSSSDSPCVSLVGCYDQVLVSKSWPETRQFCQVRLHHRDINIEDEPSCMGSSNSSRCLRNQPRKLMETSCMSSVNCCTRTESVGSSSSLSRLTEIEAEDVESKNERKRACSSKIPITTGPKMAACFHCLLLFLSFPMVLNFNSVMTVSSAIFLLSLLLISGAASMSALKFHVPKFDEPFSLHLNGLQKCSSAYRKILFSNRISSFIRYLFLHHVGKYISKAFDGVVQKNSIKLNSQQIICKRSNPRGRPISSTVASIRISLLMVLLLRPPICLGGTASPQHTPSAGCLRSVCQVASYEVEENSWGCPSPYLIDDEEGIKPVANLKKSPQFGQSEGVRQKRTPLADTPGVLFVGEPDRNLMTNNLLSRLGLFKRELPTKNYAVPPDAKDNFNVGRRFITKRDNLNRVFDDGDFNQDDYTLDDLIPASRPYDRDHRNTEPFNYRERYIIPEPVRGRLNSVRPELRPGSAETLADNFGRGTPNFGGGTPTFHRRTGGGGGSGQREDAVSFTVKEVTCRVETVKLTSVDQLCNDELRDFAHLVRKIDLSNNSLSVLTSGAFSPYSCLRKLELRANGLHTIRRGAFRGLEDLRRLDLSNNELSSLSGGQMEGLTHLKRLKLGGNPLHTLHPSLYRELPALGNLDLINTELVCDCRLAWLVAAARGSTVDQSLLLLGQQDASSQGQASRVVRGQQGEEDRMIRLSKLSSCDGPQELEGRPLKSLDPSVLICDQRQHHEGGPLGSGDRGTVDSGLHLDPGWDQVVFAGDSLTLRCFVTWPALAQAREQQAPPHDTNLKTASERSPVHSGEFEPRILWYRDDVLLNPSSSGSAREASVTSRRRDEDGVGAVGDVSTKVLTTIRPVVVNNGEQQQQGEGGDGVLSRDSEGILVNTKKRRDGMESLVEIRQLGASHGGEWACRVETPPIVTTHSEAGLENAPPITNSDSSRPKEPATVAGVEVPPEEGTHLVKHVSPPNSPRKYPYGTRKGILDSKSKSLSIYVIHGQTKYCPVNETHDNRGSLSWPHTVAGVVVSLPCHTATTTSSSSSYHHPSSTSLHHQLLYHQAPRTASLPLYSPHDEHPRTAYHTCDYGGRWAQLNTSECPFVSEVTRALQQFALTNLTETKTSLMRAAENLHNFTGDGASVLRDSADVVFLARTLGYYARKLVRDMAGAAVGSVKSTSDAATKAGATGSELTVGRGLSSTLGAGSTFKRQPDASVKNKKVALLLIDLVGASMSAAKSNLTSAEYEDFACQRLLWVLWTLLDSLPSLTHTTPPHIYTVQRPIKRTVPSPLPAFSVLSRDAVMGPKAAGVFAQNLDALAHSSSSADTSSNYQRDAAVGARSNLHGGMNREGSEDVVVEKQSPESVIRADSVAASAAAEELVSVTAAKVGDSTLQRKRVRRQGYHSEKDETDSDGRESTKQDHGGSPGTKKAEQLGGAGASLENPGGLDKDNSDLNVHGGGGVDLKPESPQEQLPAAFSSPSNNSASIRMLRERLQHQPPPPEGVVCSLFRRSVHSSQRHLHCHSSLQPSLRSEESIVDAILELPGVLISALLQPPRRDLNLANQTAVDVPGGTNTNIANDRSSDISPDTPAHTATSVEQAGRLPSVGVVQSSSTEQPHTTTGETLSAINLGVPSNRTKREALAAEGSGKVDDTDDSLAYDGVPSLNKNPKSSSRDGGAASSGVNSIWNQLSPDIISLTHDGLFGNNLNPLLLQVFAYETGDLFPHLSSSNSSYEFWELTSPIIGARISGQPFNLSLQLPSTEEGILVTLRSTIYSHSIQPVWWQPGELGKSHGSWSSEGCTILRILSSQVVFRCSRLAHYGLLQDVSLLHRRGDQRGADFKLSSPAVYIGSFLCVFFLMVTIVTWATHHPRIQTTNKNKHSYVNTWISLVLLIALFTAGIYQTESHGLCQGIGIVLHYLSSCVLLWIIVSVTNLYKKVTKALRPPLLNDDPPPDVPLPPKPMLRFYLVGWGIALILCGISAAVNLHQYAGYSYCFLAWAPSLGAFYAPCVVLVTILGIFCLLTHCMLKSSPGSYSEAAANTETTELELLDTASPNSENPTTHSGHTSHLTAHLNSDRLNEDELSLASQGSEALYDSHHSPLTQLRAHEVTLLLFVLTWASAAITTAEPFQSVIPYHTVIFSLVYAICASSLGAFIFLFFCFGRSDVKEAWKDASIKNLFRRKISEPCSNVQVANNAASSSGSGSGAHLIPVSNASAAVTNQLSSSAVLHANNHINLHHHLSSNSNSHRGNAPPSVHSLDSSQHSPTNKSTSITHNVTTPSKNDNMLLMTENVVRPHGAATLHLLNLGNVTDNLNYSPEMFYNPKQAGVAKRFFQKQRLKQKIKQNNLGLNHRDNDSDCNSSVLYRPRPARSNNSGSDVSGFDPSCLGASSKVNNTNIHVDHNMYSYMLCNNKQADKTPTPELLCVFGPHKDTSLHQTDDRQKRSYSRSPIQMDDIPRIDATSAYQYSSESSYQTPTHQKIYPLRPKENLESDNVNSASYRGPKINDFGGRDLHQRGGPFNSDIAEEGESGGKVTHKAVGSREVGRGRPGRARHKRSRSKGAVALPRGGDFSDDSSGIPLGVISGLPSESNPSNMAVKGEGEQQLSLSSSASGVGAESGKVVSLPPGRGASPCEVKPLRQSPGLVQLALSANDTSYPDTSSSTVVGFNSNAGAALSDVLNPLMDDNNLLPHTLVPSSTLPSSMPSSLHNPNNSPGGHHVHMSPSLSRARQAPRGQPHPAWPHVLAGSATTTSKPSRRPNIPWHEDLQAIGSWDSETGEEMSCCEGGGEKRLSTGDMSDRTSACGTNNTSRNSICSDVSEVGSSIGTSLVAGLDTSPPASLMISDSPFDSPLHRLHQNTPDDASIASSSVTSPVRRPFSPSNFPYFKDDSSNLNMFAYEFGNYESTEFVPRRDVVGRMKNSRKGGDTGSKSYPESPANATTPTNMPESSSADKPLSSLCYRTPKHTAVSSQTNASIPTISKTPMKPSQTTTTCNISAGNSTPSVVNKQNLDPILDVNFKFKTDEDIDHHEDFSESEYTEMSPSQTDRSSSVSTEPHHHRQMLMTTPRSEGSSDSEDYAVTFINQEPPLNIAEEFSSSRRKDKRPRKRRGADSRPFPKDKMYEEEVERFCQRGDLDEGSSRLSPDFSNPTPSTPLLAPQADDPQPLVRMLHYQASSPGTHPSPSSPPPLVPFFLAPASASSRHSSLVTQPLSTSTPVRHHSQAPASASCTSPELMERGDTKPLRIPPAIQTSLPTGPQASHEPVTLSKHDSKHSTNTFMLPPLDKIGQFPVTLESGSVYPTAQDCFGAPNLKASTQSTSSSTNSFTNSRQTCFPQPSSSSMTVNPVPLEELDGRREDDSAKVHSIDSMSPNIGDNTLRLEVQGPVYSGRLEPTSTKQDEQTVARDTAGECGDPDQSLGSKPEILIRASSCDSRTKTGVQTSGGNSPSRGSSSQAPWTSSLNDVNNRDSSDESRMLLSRNPSSTGEVTAIGAEDSGSLSNTFPGQSCDAIEEDTSVSSAYSHKDASASRNIDVVTGVTDASVLNTSTDSFTSRETCV